MGNFYYPNCLQRNYSFYVTVSNDLRDALELAEKLKETYDEVYLIDPNLNYHMKEVSMMRYELPTYLKLIVSEKTASRVVFSHPDKNVTRIYMYFEKTGDMIPYLENSVILVSVASAIQSILAGIIDKRTLRPSPTLVAYK